MCRSRWSVHKPPISYSQITTLSLLPLSPGSPVSPYTTISPYVTTQATMFSIATNMQVEFLHTLETSEIKILVQLEWVVHHNMGLHFVIINHYWTYIL